MDGYKDRRPCLLPVGRDWEGDYRFQIQAFFSKRPGFEAILAVQRKNVSHLPADYTLKKPWCRDCIEDFGFHAFC